MFVRKCLWCSSAIMKMKEESGSLAAILERELEPTVREWLRRVNLVSELTDIPLSDADRAGHLPQVYSDLISRLRLPKDKHAHISADATAHGQRRREQGYSAAMLIAESRIFGERFANHRLVTGGRIAEGCDSSQVTDLPLVGQPIG
jgi:hypothetical protein